MQDLSLVTTVATALAAAWLLGLLAQRIGLSPIVGYLVAGIAIGPHTPGIEANPEIAHQLAEIGVILLMFDVGLHFSLKELMAVRGVAIPGALGQSFVATLLGIAVFSAFGFSVPSGAILGMALAVASTVVLMRVLMDAQALQSPQGHIAVGWLLVEDVLTVIVLVLIGALGDKGAQGGAGLLGSMVWAIVKLAVLFGVLMVAGSRTIPRVLVRVAKLRSRELFTLTVLVFSIAIAAGSYFFFGASMALGAFLAGMVVAQSPVSHQAAADALPMRDTFAVLFFVSVGMLFDPAYLLQEPLLILAALAIVLVAKPATALLIVAALGYSARTALTVAVGLAQIGEFSFVLSELALKHHLLPEEGRNVLVAVAILSVAMNPFLFRTLPFVEERLRRWPVLWWILNAQAQRRAHRANLETSHQVEELPGADRRLAIVIGYGPVGRSVDRLLLESGLSTVVVEMNLDTVLELKSQGRTAIYGDATREAILKQAGVERASHLVVALPHSSQRSAVVTVARYMNPQLRILVRAHYLAERDILEEAGATAAVFEEAEAAVALARLVLLETGASREAMDRSVRDLRLQLILENVANLNRQSVRSVMVPWNRVSRLSTRDSLTDVRRKLAVERYSRWPVLDADGRPIGYLLAKDLIVEPSTARDEAAQHARMESDWARLVRPLASIRPDDDIESTLLRMQEDGATVCVVEDRGRPVGLITIEDILEQVVGRIEDEYPRERALVLTDVIGAGGIVEELVARTPEDAIRELAAAIDPARLPADAKVADAAILREEQHSTHVGLGVAIPHTPCPNLSSPIVVLGRSSEGIVFGSDFTEPVHLIFLVVTPAEKPELHLPVLGQIASLVDDEAAREKLLRADSAGAMLQVIAEANPKPQVSRSVREWKRAK